MAQLLRLGRYSKVINYSVSNSSSIHTFSKTIPENIRLCTRCQHLRQGLSGDDQFYRLRQVFFATGRGRRPDLPAVTPNNRLLLQMCLLMDEGKKTYKEAATFLQSPRLFPELSQEQLRHLLSHTKLKSDNLANASEHESFQMKTFDTSGVGPHASNVGITRLQLIQRLKLPVVEHPTNALLNDLDTFRKKEGLTFSDLCVWWSELTDTLVTVDAVKKMTTKLAQTKSKLAGTKKREEFLSFMSAPAKCLLPPSAPVGTNGSVSGSATQALSASCKDSDSSETITLLKRKCSEQRRELAATQINLQNSVQECDEVKMKLQHVTESLQQAVKEGQSLKGLVQNAEETNKSLSSANDLLIEENEQMKKKLNFYLKGSFKRQLKSQQDKCDKLEDELQCVKISNEVLTQQKNECVEKLRELQLSHADIKRKLKAAKAKLIQKAEDTAPQEDAAPQEDVARQDHDFQFLNDEIPVFRLKDERGYFKQEAIVCVMALVGEAEVAPERCGHVIQTIVRHICRAHIPDGDLPSQRSALRFADRGHLIGKAHVAETLIEADNWDLHTDGTSRSGKKYVGQQVTVEGKTLSTGFVSVAAEDTTTLVDVSISLLEELSTIHGEDHTQEAFTSMLQNLSGLMSDRASVMKSFNRAMQEERNVLLQTNEDIQFLHCNAHFLLGISAECEKILAQKEKDSGLQYGRNQLAKFQSFKKSESSAFRYIRLTCDCLGPRGDDKNGCRDSWEAYCLMMNCDSRITSFRSNRFNNLFQAAAAVHFHRDHIQDCLATYFPNKNKKLESVYEDSKSDEIDCQLTALGILYYRLTGPYWNLLGKKIHYLDFHLSVEKMHQLLSTLSTDSSPAFDQDFVPTHNDSFTADQVLLQRLLDMDEHKRAEVKLLLEALCTGLVVVTERQLADFLPDGRYYNCQDEQLRNQMSHSHLTNLVGEQAFGDLDFSLFKRRSASVFHHSTINILKRNKSVSTWFLDKSQEQQQQLLHMAAKNAPSARKRAIDTEKEAVVKKQRILQEQRQKRLDLAEKRRQDVEDFMRQLQSHHGPCFNAADVDNLLHSYNTRANQKKAIRAELKYQKQVVGNKNALLNLTGGNLLQLVRNYRTFLGEEQEESRKFELPALPRARLHIRNRVPCLSPESDTDIDVESGDEETSDDEDSEDVLPQRSHTFSEEGQLVAVYYVEDFFIGEVIQVSSPHRADINFMESARQAGKQVFRWPSRPDRCEVDSEFVFAINIILEPSSSSGRAFKVSSPKNLAEQYQSFKRSLEV